jgi:hypothetical protein
LRVNGKNEQKIGENRTKKIKIKICEKRTKKGGKTNKKKSVKTEQKRKLST